MLGTFCVEEEVFPLLYMEGSFVLLPTDGVATVVDIRSHVTTRHWMEICLQHGDILQFGTLLHRRRWTSCREMLVGGAARVQLSTWSWLPYTILNSARGIGHWVMMRRREAVGARCKLLTSELCKVFRTISQAVTASSGIRRKSMAWFYKKKSYTYFYLHSYKLLFSSKMQQALWLNG